MLPPVHILGPAIAGGIILLKKNDLSQDKTRKPIILKKRRYYIKRKTPNTVENPLKVLVEGLSSQLSRIIKRNAPEDYNAVVKGFLPEGAELLIPKYPMRSTGIHLVDIDGDSHNELVASFRHDEAIKTIVLKKQNDWWNKVAELNNSEYNTLNFRGVVDITGEGKKQLLMGMTSEDKEPVLYGYSMGDSRGFNELFDLNYHRFEILNTQKKKGVPSKAVLAVWNRKEDEAYDIRLHQWDGEGLKLLNNSRPYFVRNVIPYHVQKIKKAPYNTANWYNLACALEKAGLYRDALIAVDMGLSQGVDSTYKDRFESIREKIVQ